MFRYWLVLFYHSLRYIRAKRRGKTLRLKVDDFINFSTILNDINIPIIVLRWWDSIPLTKEQIAQYPDDVDCLIDENNIWPIIKLAAKHPGSVKVDLYGICGRNGTSYKGMPYYPPILAEEIYRSRVLQNGYYIPSKEVYKYSFLYHVVYHKGPESGLGFDFKNTEYQENKFHKEITRLSEFDELLSSNNSTLCDLHGYLKASGWSMPLDLMPRWKGNVESITKLQYIEEQELLDMAAQLKGLVIFIIRDDAYIMDSHDIIQSMINERFEILLDYQLSEVQSDSIMRNTRGGNWTEKRKKSPTKPIEMWICKPKFSSGPVSEKMKKKYPLVDNYEVLIKREIRDKVNEMDAVNRIVLHASDNDIESAIILSATFGVQVSKVIRKLL